MPKFSQFNIDKSLIEALTKLKFIDTSPIQTQAIPLLLKGKDGIYKAPTGSGKTLAYLVPIINNIKSDLGTQAVIIVPTKVLASQVASVLKEIVKVYPNFTMDVIIDGRDVANLSSGSNIIITTPSLFLAIKKDLRLKELKYLIFDEGDMLIFGGFERELATILAEPYKCTKALFTASVDEHLNNLVKKYLNTATLIDVTLGSVTSSNVKHVFVDVRHLDKGQALKKFIEVMHPYKTIAFVSSKVDLQEVEEFLLTNRISHSYVHGDLPKRDQKKAIKDFKEDRTTLLLASDIAARGFDVPEVSDVISLDLPKDMTYYFHRAGRTGRFNNGGTSYIFYSGTDIAKPRELIKKGGNIFTYTTLKDDGLRADRDLNSVQQRKKINNIYLEKEIQMAIAKNKTKKVKPGYKKKVKRAIERVKQKHKENIIKTNIYKKKKKEEQNNNER